MITLTKITLSSDRSVKLTTVAQGKPQKFEDISSLVLVDSFIKYLHKGAVINVDCEVLGYGAEEPCEADIFEVAYILKRQERDEDFFETRCKQLETYSFTFAV